jgi:hypothetical protein
MQSDAILLPVLKKSFVFLNYVGFYVEYGLVNVMQVCSHEVFEER